MVRNSGRKVSLSVVRSQDPEGPLGGLLLFVGARTAAGSFAGHPALSEIGLPLPEGRGDENLHRIRSPQYYLERKKKHERKIHIFPFVQFPKVTEFWNFCFRISFAIWYRKFLQSPFSYRKKENGSDNLEIARTFTFPICIHGNYFLLQRNLPFLFSSPKK